MGVKMSSEAQLVLFNKVFEHDAKSLALVKGLVNHGVKFEAGGNTIVATFKDVYLAVTLTTSTSSLLSHSGVFEAAPVAAEQIKDFLKKLSSKLSFKINLLPVAVTTTIDYGESMLKINKEVAKIQDEVVKLQDATCTGQKVFGTSAGSVYRCVALNSRVKLATRVQGDTVSFRVETAKATEQEELCFIL